MDNHNTYSNIFTYAGPLSTRMACHMGEMFSESALSISAMCNIVGNQPLFYIDYVDEEEADFIDPMMLGDFLDGEELFVPMTQGSETMQPDLRARINRLQGASAHIDGYVKHDALAVFDATLEKLKQAPKLTALDDVLTAINTSRFLNNLLNDVSNAGVKIKSSAQVDRAVYDREQKIIYINPSLEAFEGAIAASAPLRQAWMHLKGAAIHPLHFAPEEAILLNRIQVADLAVTALRAAWEMKLAGHDGVWSRMLTGSSYDIAQSFAREAIADFRALASGAASNAAFEKWFLSDRCKEVDRNLIQSMLSDNHGLVFNHPQVSRSVTADIIARTGEQPQGKNYLTNMVEIILADPLFTEIRDRSNANFLWFIKFERSFRMSEGEVEKPAQNPVAYADIVKFPTKSRNFSQIKAGYPENEATIYYLDHFLSLSNR